MPQPLSRIFSAPPPPSHGPRTPITVQRPRPCLKFKLTLKGTTPRYALTHSHGKQHHRQEVVRGATARANNTTNRHSFTRHAALLPRHYLHRASLYVSGSLRAHRLLTRVGSLALSGPFIITTIPASRRDTKPVSEHSTAKTTHPSSLTLPPLDPNYEMREFNSPPAFACALEAFEDPKTLEIQG
jgi:hypothetical protein